MLPSIVRRAHKTALFGVEEAVDLSIRDQFVELLRTQCEQAEGQWDPRNLACTGIAQSHPVTSGIDIGKSKNKDVPSDDASSIDYSYAITLGVFVVASIFWGFARP